MADAAKTENEKPVDEFAEGLVDETTQEEDEPLFPDEEETPAPTEETEAVEAKVEKKEEVVEERKPAYLVKAAKSFGISDEKIAKMSAEKLDEFLVLLEDQRQAEAEAKAAKEKAAEPEEEDEDEVLIRELQEELDPKVFKLLEKSFLKTKALEAERKAEKQTAQQRQQQELVTQVDAAFADLDSPLLGGKAVVGALSLDSEEMERRNLIVRAAIEKPIPGKSLGETVKVYAKKILGIAASEQTAASPLEEKKKKWQAAASQSARPTAKVQDAEKGDEAAVKAVGRWMKENGWNDDD